MPIKFEVVGDNAQDVIQDLFTLANTFMAGVVPRAPMGSGPGSTAPAGQGQGYDPGKPFAGAASAGQQERNADAGLAQALDRQKSLDEMVEALKEEPLKEDLKQTEQPQQDVLPPAEKPKTERKKKAEAKPEPKQIELEAAIADAAPVPPIEDIRAALMKLSKAKGDDAVWNILEKFKAKSASTVAEGERAKLVAEINEITA